MAWTKESLCERSRRNGNQIVGPSGWTVLRRVQPAVAVGDLRRRGVPKHPDSERPLPRAVVDAVVSPVHGADVRKRRQHVRLLPSACRGGAKNHDRGDCRGDGDRCSHGGDTRERGSGVQLLGVAELAELGDVATEEERNRPVDDDARTFAGRAGAGTGGTSASPTNRGSRAGSGRAPPRFPCAGRASRPGRACGSRTAAASR